ncbi:MAG: efflux RND transporter periplasmic adaptor subunit [bacterium]|nr:efflux RND transporter periplasmic adaptor subunit [bacterium]
MTGVDLRELRIDETATKTRAPLGPRILAWGVVALLVTVALTFLWPLLRPTRLVTTAAIRPADVASPTSTVATAEAVGWVEPEPFATEIKPLVTGRIRSLDVLEGTEIVAGETVLATLESAALAAAHDRAKARIGEREHEIATAAARLKRARDHRAQHAVHRSELARARVTLADKTAKHVEAENRVRELEATARATAAAERAQQRLAETGNSNAVALERAQAEAASARAAIITAEALTAALARECDAARAAIALQEEFIENPVDLDNDVAIAESELAAARQRLATARTELAIAERELGWAERVVSPISGKVMRLTSAPGNTAGPGNPAIVAIYDPTRLQARIDVPLDSVAGVHPGQRVELRSEITGNQVVAGTVLRVQHETDLLKNTLQVKIRLHEPPAVWRPETLCRARFLGREAGTESAESTPTAFLVPTGAVRGNRVFVVDPAAGTARAVPVETLGQDGGATIVRGALSVTQRVILEPVDDGETVEEKP